MKNRICWRAALAACAIVAWAILGCEEDPEPTGDEYTQAVMREIFEGIRVALPASIWHPARGSTDTRIKIVMSRAIIQA